MPGISPLLLYTVIEPRAEVLRDPWDRPSHVGWTLLGFLGSNS